MKKSEMLDGMETIMKDKRLKGLVTQARNSMGALLDACDLEDSPNVRAALQLAASLIVAQGASALGLGDLEVLL